VRRAMLFPFFANTGVAGVTDECVVEPDQSAYQTDGMWTDTAWLDKYNSTWELSHVQCAVLTFVTHRDKYDLETMVRIGPEYGPAYAMANEILTYLTKYIPGMSNAHEHIGNWLCKPDQKSVVADFLYATKIMGGLGYTVPSNIDGCIVKGRVSEPNWKTMLSNRVYNLKKQTRDEANYTTVYKAIRTLYDAQWADIMRSRVAKVSSSDFWRLVKGFLCGAISELVHRSVKASEWGHASQIVDEPDLNNKFRDIADRWKTHRVLQTLCPAEFNQIMEGFLCDLTGKPPADQAVMRSQFKSSGRPLMEPAFSAAWQLKEKGTPPKSCPRL